MMNKSFSSLLLVLVLLLASSLLITTKDFVVMAQNTTSSSSTTTMGSTSSTIVETNMTATEMSNETAANITSSTMMMTNASSSSSVAPPPPTAANTTMEETTMMMTNTSTTAGDDANTTNATTVTTQMETSSTAMSTSSSPNTTTSTTTLLPTWTSFAPGQGSFLAPMEVKFTFLPQVSPSSPANVLRITKEILTFREGMRALLQTDLANFMNIFVGEVSVGEFRGLDTGEFFTTVTFSKPTNYTAYEERLKFYASSTTPLPAALFPRMDQVVRDSAAPGITVLGVKMISVEHLREDTHDALCFLGQEQCLGAYLIIVVGVLLVVGGISYGIKKKFDSWKEDAPTKERTFNQEGLGNRTDMNDLDAAANDREMSLMQQYQNQETARSNIARAQQRAGGSMHVDDML